MNLGLKDRVAIVTAASEGLGQAIALDLASEGVRLAICARTERTLAETAERIRQETGAQVMHQTCDLMDASQTDAFIDAVAEEFGGRIDVLVNNCGGPPPGPYTTVTLEQWRLAFERNFLTIVRCCDRAIPFMRRNGWGRIINVTSSSARQPIDGLATSNAIRPGIVGLAKTMSRELGPDGITVNNVAPGMFRTRRHEELLESMAKSEGKTPQQILEQRVSQIPLGRMGDPAENAHMVTFLASERASYITGQNFLVDGGLVRGLS